MSQVRTQLRLPKALRDQLDALAAQDGRSLNNYVARVLERHVKECEK